MAGASAAMARGRSRCWSLTLASNGVDAARLGIDMSELAAAFATPTTALRSTTGKRLGAARTGTALVDGTTSQTISRADLHAVLRDALLARGIRIEHGKRLVTARHTADGVRATFADGSEASRRSTTHIDWDEPTRVTA